MKKQTIYYACLITFVVLYLTACKKDGTSPNNPLNGRTTAVFNPDKTYGKMTDVDGNQYKTIKIGNHF